jgi:hypothetical protein
MYKRPKLKLVLSGPLISKGSTGNIEKEIPRSKRNVVVFDVSDNIIEYSRLAKALNIEIYYVSWKKDFDQIPNNGSISFYSLINKLVKRNLVNYIAKEQGSAAKILALTGTGLDIYNKISKFTNKFLSEGETKS